MAKQSRVANKFLVDEQEFVKHRDYFLEMARKKYPSGFSFLSDFQKSESHTGEIKYQVEFSEPMRFLLNYLGSEYKERPHMRDEVFVRLIQHLITHGYN